MTLREWQTIRKPRRNLIVNASSTDGSDSPQQFPIGLYYKYLLFDKLETQIGTHADLVFCGIRCTDQRRNTINRSTIVQTLDSNGIRNTILDLSEYFTKLPNYKFVISPEGNGIDCHRHYEALMAGCIPIVEDNPHIRSVYGNCPILYTSNYSEITPTYLTQKYTEMLDLKYDFSRLFISSYPMNLQYKILENSCFWTKGNIPRPGKNNKWGIK